ncbi:mRNA 3'-end-processing protein rna14 [Tulasnella sp. 418]|nr:mRNA 3'-end-processing protein rna14 [Tulasnella sp. 418]
MDEVASFLAQQQQQADEESYVANQLEGDSSTSAQHAQQESGGYSPSQVMHEYDQEDQQRGYSPSNVAYHYHVGAVDEYDPSSLFMQQQDPNVPETDAQGDAEEPSDSHEPAGETQELPVQTAVAPTPQPQLTPPHAQGSVAPGTPSTPVVTSVQPVTSQPAVSDGPPLTPLEAARARTRDNKHDHAAWNEYLALTEQTADLEKVKDTYEELLHVFPNNASAQIAYLTHFQSSPPLFPRAEALFSRFLRPSPSVELWKFYLTYVRRVNTNTTDPSTRDVVRKAYEFALSHVGHDMDSGQIWRDYIDFLKNTLDSKTTWDAQQKMDALRSAYHRAVVIPLDNVEALWRELDQFENGLNKITAKKFLADLSPAHMTARTALRDLKRLIQPIATPTSYTAGSSASIVLPPSPTWVGEADRQLVTAWKAYLKWEEGNPLDLEDQKVLQLRITSAYAKAVARMRFFPEISYMAFTSLNGMGKTEEATTILKQGIEANPASFLLNFAYAELLENNKHYAEVHAIYDMLINTLQNQIEKLDNTIKQEVREARQSALSNGSMEESSGTAIVEAEDRARKVAERRAKDLEAAKNELGVAWIMEMRFARRAEGLKPARTVFSKARKDKWCSWSVYEAAALMEYHSTKTAEVSTKIFEIGLKTFGEDVEFVLRYLGFLISVNDENNARALFERVITTFSPEAARPLWERWARYEYSSGDFAAVQKLDKRLAETYPDDPSIKRFAQRYTYLGIDVIALRDLGFSNRSQSTALVPALPATSMTAVSSDMPVPQPIPPAVSSAMNNGSTKRTASPAGDPRRRRDQSPPPSKRFKASSPTRGEHHERERGRRGSPPARRGRDHRDKDAVPDGVVWFMSTLPSAAAFDGPKFRVDDLLQLFKTADIPYARTTQARSRSPPARGGGRPPPDYAPYQGPGGGSGGGGGRGRRY